MELEAVLKERGASAGDPARMLGAWVKRGWPAGPEPEITSRPAEGGRVPELEYEALPEGSTVTTHMMAGAVAGIMEHCLMYPVDCVKTRMQSLQPDPAARYRNVMEALFKIIRTEGIWRPIRGLNVTATGAGPAHALYFACYEKLKKTLSDVIRPGGNSHIANGIDDCAYPLDCTTGALTNQTGPGNAHLA